MVTKAAEYLFCSSTIVTNTLLPYNMQTNNETLKKLSPQVQRLPQFLLGWFTPSNSVTVTITIVMLTGKTGKQPILPVAVPIKMIKGAAHQCYRDNDGVVRCEQTFMVELLRRRAIP